MIQSCHKATATSTITLVDVDTVTFQTAAQTLDGKPMADSPVITMKHMK